MSEAKIQLSGVEAESLPSDSIVTITQLNLIGIFGLKSFGYQLSRTLSV